MAATATTAARNGTIADVSFPLDSFRAAAPHLRRPFTPQAVKFKVQAVWPKDQPTGGLIVAYIDARLAVERLNLIVPHLWHDDYEPVAAGLLCLLTVDGITRKDVGEGKGKALYSDALKRAAVKFGVGVSLYATPKIIVNADGQRAKPKRSRDGMTLELTPVGETHVRRLYHDWLVAHGIKAFGEPLDHGDVDDAQGDADLEPSSASSPDTESGEVASPDAIKHLHAAAKGLKGTQVKLALSSLGLAAPQPFTADSAFNAVPQSKAAELAQLLATVERVP